MPYQYIASSATPRLLILLTDELEESVKLVNSLINRMILSNLDGNAPKNRCFISVIGYNHKVNELCSGWLKDLDARPLRYETLKKKTPDGVEVEVLQPVWVSPSNSQQQYKAYTESIKLATGLACLWSEDNVISPIVIDISEECHAYSAVNEIESLKEISTKDGNVLFFGSYSKYEDVVSPIFSRMPEQWKWLFRNREEIEKKYFHNGILDREKIFPIISYIIYTGGLQSGFLGFTI